jgi:hypothetical protein
MSPPTVSLMRSIDSIVNALVIVNTLYWYAADVC